MKNNETKLVNQIEEMLDTIGLAVDAATAFAAATAPEPNTMLLLVLVGGGIGACRMVLKLMAR